MVDFRLPLPRKGTETNSLGAIPPNSRMISDYLYPARGRKRKDSFTIIKEILLDFRLPLPRKGTETAVLSCGLDVSTKFPTTFTPQGDGNPAGACGIACLRCRFPTTFTPQGDGNFGVDNSSKGSIPPNFRLPLPRKGTETNLDLMYKAIAPVFPTTFTPQGDGNRYRR